MVGFAHVALHVALCRAAVRVSSQTPIAMHVRVADRIGRAQVDRVYKMQRSYGDENVVEFDVERGVYRLTINVPKYRCSGSDFLAFMSDHDRSIKERLSESSYTEAVPLLLNGTLPPAFLYAEPTFVIFERGSICNKPIGDPLPLRSNVEIDSDAYYAQLYSDASLEARGSVLLALRLKTAAGQYHYIRVPTPFPVRSGRWPDDFQLGVAEDYLDTLATEPVDTLLCPKMTKTSVS